MRVFTRAQNSPAISNAQANLDASTRRKKASVMKHANVIRCEGNIRGWCMGKEMRIQQQENTALPYVNCLFMPNWSGATYTDTVLA